jgi:hypothetical protein
MEQINEISNKIRNMLFNTDDIKKVIFGIKAKNGRMVKHKVIDEENSMFGNTLYISKVSNQSSCFTLSELGLIQNVQAGNVKILTVNK